MKIGNFRKTDTGFAGRILTLELQSDKVLLVRRSEHDKYDVFVGEVLVGTAVGRQGDDETIDVELDDPSFSAPIRAQIGKEGNGSYSLIWQRNSNK